MPPEPGPQKLAVVEPNGDVYSVELDPEVLTKLGELALEAGTHQPELGAPPDGFEDPEELATPEIEQKGWSNGIDNRTPRGIHEIGFSYPERTIGNTSTYCTATFIPSAFGQYYALTAAHCLYDDNGNWQNPFLVPRNDGCRRPDGSDIPNCDFRPYGEWQNAGAGLYQYYIDNCRTSAQAVTTNCFKRDIALLRVVRPGGEGYPGSMGYGYLTQSTLSGLYARQRGYPGCSTALVVDPGAPNGPGGSAGPGNVCRSGTLYGNDGCTRSDYDYPDSNGQHQLIRTSCDISGGHSGGPSFVQMSSGSWIIYAEAVSTSPGNCYGSCTWQRPSRIRRITTEWMDIMDWFRGY